SIRTRRPNVTGSLANVVAKATAKKVDDRFQTAHELAEAMRQAGVTSRGGGGTAGFHVSRKAAIGIGAAVVVLAGIAVFGLKRGAYGGDDDAHSAPPVAAVKVATLPFEALGEGDQAAFGRQAVRLMSDALDHDQVPVIDDEELL